MRNKIKAAAAAMAATVVMTVATIGFGGEVASAHGTHINPCYARVDGINPWTGQHKTLIPLWGGYDYSWDQGWLTVWDQGTPYHVWWDEWQPFGC